MKARRVLWFGAALMAIYVLSMMLMPSDEKKIGKLVEQARVACENEDLSRLMGFFDLGYRDDEGLTYAAWKMAFEAAFRKYDDIRIRVLSKDVEVADDGKDATVRITARGEATVAATKGDPNQAADRPVGQADRAEINLKKTPTGWKIHSARYLRQSEW